jgi:hypothetical protein
MNSVPINLVVFSRLGNLKQLIFKRLDRSDLAISQCNIDISVDQTIGIRNKLSYFACPVGLWRLRTLAYNLVSVSLVESSS